MSYSLLPLPVQSLAPLGDADVAVSTTSLSAKPQSSRPTTLAQIAKHVGVSSAAVSAVLRNTQTGIRVSEATRQRILEAAHELNYRPNMLARSLANGWGHTNSDTIGFCNHVQSTFGPRCPLHTDLLSGLLTGCEKYQKNLLLHKNCLVEDSLYREVLSGHIDGLVLYAHQETPFIQCLAQSRLPVVTVANQVPHLPCVTGENATGGRLLASYLATKGYRHILYWLPAGAWSAGSLASSLQERYDGFRQEAHQRGLTVESFCSPRSQTLASDIETMMNRGVRPEVIAAYNDTAASTLLSWCQTHGMRVPQDVAITGFDGTTHATSQGHALGISAFSGELLQLTTVRVPWPEVAQTAVSLVLRQGAGNTIPLRVQLPVELVAGQTA